MSEERERLPAAVGLIKDRIPGPPPKSKPKLEPASTLVAEPPETDTESDPKVKSSIETTAKAQKKPRARVAPAASAASTGGQRRTTVSIPHRLASLVQERLDADRRLTMIEVILSAVEAAAPHLADLVSAERPSAAGPVLFPDRGARRAAPEPRTVINLVTTERNFAVIDSLVEQSGAASRSDLIRLAFEHFFGE